jgi:hypothetical protein
MPGEVPWSYAMSPLYYRRSDVRQLLGLGDKSNFVLELYERRGWLKPVRLSGNPRGDVFYSATEIAALPELLREWEAANG